MAGFMQQEVIHGEEHERFNYDIAEQGYPYLYGIERFLVKGTCSKQTVNASCT